MRRRLVVTVAVLILAVVADVRRPPDHQITNRAAIGAIRLYQSTLSKMYARMGVQCRFTVTCSHYGEACLREFGVVTGGWLAVKRVLRCGPWTPMGTTDLPPTQKVAAPQT